MVQLLLYHPADRVLQTGFLEVYVCIAIENQIALGGLCPQVHSVEFPQPSFRELMVVNYAQNGVRLC